MVAAAPDDPSHKGSTTKDRAAAPGSVSVVLLPPRAHPSLQAHSSLRLSPAVADSPRDVMGSGRVARRSPTAVVLIATRW